ncbi:threonyl-tRNA synthetase, partial [mine drainage metagenome]
MDDLASIEERMRMIVSRDVEIIKKELTKNELLSLFKNNKYKIDKINENVPEGNSSTVYIQGDYSDFCKGPHVPRTSYIKTIKLLSIASTNYRGDVKLESMVRIYGTAFLDEKSLKAFLKDREEAAKRDHRKIGAEMDLFVFNSERAPGLPLYTPNGAFIRSQLIDFMRAMNLENGWQEVCTPHLFKNSMWKQSGHYAKYKDDMFLFTLADGDEYGLKPMNCPGHITIYENSPHSYRDMPVKFSEFGTVYRYEKSGEVGGLSRPRTFTIDDGHAFLRSDQIEEEIGKTLDMIMKNMNVMLSGWPVSFDLSLMDKNKLENYLIQYKCKSCSHFIEPVRKSATITNIQCPECGSEELEPDFSVWDSATDQLRNALLSRNIKFKEFEGEAAFYGPKIDVHVKDAFNRSWQLSTLQLDFNMPRSFGLYYINNESKHDTPI